MATKAALKKKLEQINQEREEEEHDLATAIVKAQQIAKELFGQVAPEQVFALHRMRKDFIEEPEDVELFVEKLKVAKEVCVDLFGAEAASTAVVLDYFDEVVMEARTSDEEDEEEDEDDDE